MSIVVSVTPVSRYRTVYRPASALRASHQPRSRYQSDSSQHPNTTGLWMSINGLNVSPCYLRCPICGKYELPSFLRVESKL